MTDNEIIKSLECCQTEYERNCEECPYEKFKMHSISAVTCSSRLRGDLLDLINRQKAEINRLNNELHGKVEYIQEQRDVIDEKKAEVDDLLEQLSNADYDHSLWKQEKRLVEAEAVKEFAERLKTTMEDLARMDFRGSTYFCVGLHHIDNVVKEFTEGKADEDK